MNWHAEDAVEHSGIAMGGCEGGSEGGVCFYGLRWGSDYSESIWVVRDFMGYLFLFLFLFFYFWCQPEVRLLVSPHEMYDVMWEVTQKNASWRFAKYWIKLEAEPLCLFLPLRLASYFNLLPRYALGIENGGTW